MQVIVCDDDIENLNEMINVCRDVMVKGTEVRGFSDARMLAESLQAHTVQPALMLLDIEMPELSGLELREQMASKLRMTDIDVSQILYIQSADNYSQITFYLRGEVVQALQTYTMKEWEQILQEQGFCRVSRFVIVNYAYVEDIQKTSLFMEDGTRFVIPNGKVRKLRQEYITYAREHERIL